MVSKLCGRLELKKLVLTGDGKKEAVIKFKQGVNVIVGASDTGKSYAFSCIDFALGSKGEPKKIPEARGYQNVFLEIKETESNEVITLRRDFGENKKNKIYIYYGNYKDKDNVNAEEFSYSSSAKKNISQKLLNYCDCTYEKVMKSRLKTQSFTFRSFIPLIMMDESRITGSQSAIYRVNMNSTSSTSEVTAFKTIISGIDYKNQKNSESNEIKKARIHGRIEQLNEIINEIRIENKDILENVKDSKLENGLSEIEELNNFIDEKTKIISECESEYRSIQKEIENVNAEINRLTNTNNKFVLLRKNYLSDIERLDFIFDAFDLTQQLVDVECPICHSQIKSTEIEKTDDYYKALLAEKNKIEIQLTELDETINDLSDELSRKKENLDRLIQKEENIADNLNNKLGPVVTEKMKKVQKLLSIQEKIDLVEQNENKIAKYEEEICTNEEQLKKSKTEDKSNIGEIAEIYIEALFNEIKSILNECGFSVKDMKYNNKIKDVVIDGKDKSAYGKGARAIINAAFLIGIMNYCFKRNMCHPGMVILDSPLTTYKERDKNDDESDESIDKGKIEKFYEMLIKESKGQVIVFDNAEPDKKIRDQINYLHFSGTSTIERKGFIPDNI